MDGSNLTIRLLVAILGLGGAALLPAIYNRAQSEPGTHLATSSIRRAIYKKAQPTLGQWQRLYTLPAEAPGPAREPVQKVNADKAAPMTPQVGTHGRAEMEVTASSLTLRAAPGLQSARIGAL